MFRSRASVLRGARLIGRRSLHRRQAADAVAAAVVGTPRVDVSQPELRRDGYSSRSAAGFSTAAAGLRAAESLQQGERFPSLLITADAITAQ